MEPGAAPVDKGSSVSDSQSYHLELIHHVAGGSLGATLILGLLFGRLVQNPNFGRRLNLKAPLIEVGCYRFSLFQNFDEQTKQQE